MEEPRLRKARAEFFAFMRGVEAAAREYREEGFRGWMWALRTLGVDPPSRRSSTIEGAVFLDGVRRKRQRALLALDPVGLRRAVGEELDAVLICRAERALSSVRRAGDVFDFLVDRRPRLSVPDDEAHADVLRERNHYRGDDPAVGVVVTPWLDRGRPDPVFASSLARVSTRAGTAEDLRYVRYVLRSRLALRWLRTHWNRRVAEFRNRSVTRPAPPPAGAPRDDADGWGAIDSVDVVDCAVSVFPMAQDLGGRDQEWVIAVGDALALWERGDERNVERGLKWFLILPQLLLRKPPRGGKRGRGELNSRFRAWRERRMGDLLRWWRTDRRNRRVPTFRERETDEVVREALALFRDRQMSKAVSLLTGAAQLDATDPLVHDALRDLHPARRGPVPAYVPVPGETPVTLDSLDGVLRALKSRRGVGVSGMKNEYLRVFASSFDDAVARAACARLQTVRTTAGSRPCTRTARTTGSASPARSRVSSAPRSRYRRSAGCSTSARGTSGAA